MKKELYNETDVVYSHVFIRGASSLNIVSGGQALDKITSQINVEIEVLAGCLSVAIE